MGPAREFLQHTARVIRVGRLSEGLSAHPHDRVRGNEKTVLGLSRELRANGLGLLGGEAKHEVNGVLAWQTSLVDVCGYDLEREPGVGEQLVSAGGL